MSTSIRWLCILALSVVASGAAAESCGADRPTILATTLLWEIRQLFQGATSGCVAVAVLSPAAEDPPDAVILTLKRHLRLRVLPVSQRAECKYASLVWAREPSCKGSDEAIVQTETADHCPHAFVRRHGQWVHYPPVGPCE